MSGKIYTCYFSGLGDRSGRAISLTMQQPPRFKIPVARELCPPFGMYWKFLRGRMSVNQFSQIYRMRFDLLNPKDIAERYEGKILVSWEGYEDKDKTVLKFSHRHLVAEWLRKNGFEVEELEPMSRKRRIL